MAPREVKNHVPRWCLVPGVPARDVQTKICTVHYQRNREREAYGCTLGRARSSAHASLLPCGRADTDRCVRHVSATGARSGIRLYRNPKILGIGRRTPRAHPVHILRVVARGVVSWLRAGSESVTLASLRVRVGEVVVIRELWESRSRDPEHGSRSVSALHKLLAKSVLGVTTMWGKVNTGWGVDVPMHRVTARG